MEALTRTPPANSYSRYLIKCAQSQKLSASDRGGNYQVEGFEAPFKISGVYQKWLITKE